MSAFNSAGRPDLAQKFADPVNHEVSGGNVGGLEDWMTDTMPRVGTGAMDQRLDKAAELTELDRPGAQVRDPTVVPNRMSASSATAL
ncbi:hypothetical protein [Nocardia tengchongensis]|uniref:hypothetical protein n=1 Tax=Nocardia tengchongensis TaxID=2055889 RepID=UPI0036B5920C